MVKPGLENMEEAFEVDQEPRWGMALTFPATARMYGLFGQVPQLPRPRSTLRASTH